MISLLVATRDRREELLRTLGATAPAVLRAAGEVRVFDDGSRDGTAAAVASAFPAVTVERHPAGVGYIAARNRLLAATRAPVALILDDDAEVVSQDFVAALLAHFAAEPDCGAIACRLVWGKGPPRVEIDPTARPEPVRGFVGCGHAWRMTAWREVGPYPEWLGFYGEELWASAELVRRGYRVDWLPSVVVHHRVVPGERPPAERRRRNRWQVRSGLAVMLLTYPATVLPRRLGHAVLAQARRLVRRHGVAGLVDLAVVGGGLLRRARHLVRWRRPLGGDAWRRFDGLPAERVWSAVEEAPS